MWQAFDKYVIRQSFGDFSGQSSNPLAIDVLQCGTNPDEVKALPKPK